MKLQVIDGMRHTDLPNAWDGEPITWRGWSEGRTTLALHLPAEQLACDKCGTVDEPLINLGRRQKLIDLQAFRCRHCGHDRVHDDRTDETWDLDETDYGRNGSEDVKDTLW